MTFSYIWFWLPLYFVDIHKIYAALSVCLERETDPQISSFGDRNKFVFLDHVHMLI